MKKTYHLCLSAGDEVMFRDLEDYHRGFNCFAVALYKTDSVGLVESFMATHTHQMVQTQVPKELMFSFRNPRTPSISTTSTVGAEDSERTRISPWRSSGIITPSRQPAMY